MKLSVITINFNNRDGLRKTIESVVNQTYKDFEYIVIDGGSTDGSVDVIKEYADRIDYWVSEPDKGIYNAMNKGIDVAKGEYCNFMNSGDIYYNANVLSEMNKFMSGVDIVYGRSVYSDGTPTLKRQDRIPDIIHFISDTISHQASFISTTLLRKYHYDENLRIVSDWKFFIQAFVLEKCRYKNICKVINIQERNGISACIDLMENERTLVLNELFPQYVVDAFEKLVYGDTWEEKLYVGIQNSKISSIMYTINVVILRFISLFHKGKIWIDEFPFQK